MTKLHIFRHGQTEWNVLGKMQGHQDSQLSELGRRQACDAKSKLVGETLRAAYCSTSIRAIETTQILLGDRKLPIHQMDELREINLGVWEGMNMKEVSNLFPVEYQAFWGQPGAYQSVDGETFHELQARAVEAVVRIMEDNRGHTILLVSHAAFIKTTLAYFERRPFDRIWEPPVAENLSHSIIVEREPQSYEIALYCDKKWKN